PGRRRGPGDRTVDRLGLRVGVPGPRRRPAIGRMGCPAGRRTPVHHPRLVAGGHARPGHRGPGTGLHHAGPLPANHPGRSTTMTTTAAPESPATGTAAARQAAAAPAGSASRRLLDIGHLDVSFATGRGRAAGTTHVVKDVSLSLEAGQCLAIVGESGSGKSVTARTLVGLPGRGARVSAARLEVAGHAALDRPERSWRRIRGADIGFILQDALVSLDPLRPVGREIEESLRLHGVAGAAVRRRKAIALLASVGVPQPDLRARQRPDQLSGGLRQRALIASAIALDPGLVIADEPTTALDVTVQAQVLD